MGGVSRKNQWDEIVGVFIREKLWLENSEPIGRRDNGKGACPNRETSCGGQRPSSGGQKRM